MTEYARIADERLRKLQEAEWEIKTCMQRIEELEDIAQCCSSLKITEKVQKSVTGNKMEEAVVELLEEQGRLKTLAGEWVDIKKRVLAELDVLPPLYRDLLLRKYCDREKCEDTANELHYSESHLRLLRRKALEQLGKSLQKNT